MLKGLKARIASLSSDVCTNVRVAERRIVWHPVRRFDRRFPNEAQGRKR
jgi:hypothetical protein